LGTPRLRLINSSNSLYHKPLGTPRLRTTNSSNSLYHKVLGYSRLHINPANSPNYTIAGLNHLSPPAWRGLTTQVASLDPQHQVIALFLWLIECPETVSLWPVKGFADLGTEADSRICDTVSCPFI
jgi:hypothetical protein